MNDPRAFWHAVAVAAFGLSIGAGVAGLAAWNADGEVKGLTAMIVLGALAFVAFIAEAANGR